MRSGKLNWLSIVILTLTLAACGHWEHAEVTVAFQGTANLDPLQMPTADRQTVQDAFKHFYEKSGYDCGHGFKHADSLTCRGPKDLHLVFQPTLNKPEFVASFSWADISGRSHNEFVHLVADFQSQMSAAVGESNVRVKAGA